MAQSGYEKSLGKRIVDAPVDTFRAFRLVLPIFIGSIGIYTVAMGNSTSMFAALIGAMFIFSLAYAYSTRNRSLSDVTQFTLPLDLYDNVSKPESVEPQVLTYAESIADTKGVLGANVNCIIYDDDDADYLVELTLEEPFVSPQTVNAIKRNISNPVTPIRPSPNIDKQNKLWIRID